MNAKEAIQHFGNIKNLADALQIKYVQSVYQWGDKVPMRRQYQLQLMTKGKLKADPESDKSAA